MSLEFGPVGCTIVGIGNRTCEEAPDCGFNPNTSKCGEDRGLNIILCPHVNNTYSTGNKEKRRMLSLTSCMMHACIHDIRHSQLYIRFEFRT